MSVTDFEQFDLVSVHKDGYVILTINDHLLWDNDEEYHLAALNTKLNNYLEGIETGQLDIAYPEANGREILIQIVSKYRPSDRGYEYLRLIKGDLEADGYDIVMGFLQDGQIVTEEIE